MAENCPICGDKNSYSQYEDFYKYCECPICGKFFLDENILDDFEKSKYNLKKLKAYLFYHKSNMCPFLIDAKKYNESVNETWKHTYNLIPEMVENWYPKTFAEKIDKILLQLNKKHNI